MWRANCWLLALAAPASSGPASAVSLASLTLHFSPICFQNGFFARGNWLIKRTASLAGSQARCRSLPLSLSCQLGLPRLSLAFISCHLIKQTTDFGTKSCQTCMFQVRAFHILVRPTGQDRNIWWTEPTLSFALSLDPCRGSPSSQFILPRGGIFVTTMIVGIEVHFV